jgi:hypothetical protein
MTTSPSVVESIPLERPDHVGGGPNLSNQVGIVGPTGASQVAKETSFFIRKKPAGKKSDGRGRARYTGDCSPPGERATAGATNTDGSPNPSME